MSAHPQSNTSPGPSQRRRRRCTNRIRRRCLPLGQGCTRSHRCNRGHRFASAVIKQHIGIKIERGFVGATAGLDHSILCELSFTVEGHRNSDISPPSLIENTCKLTNPERPPGVVTWMNMTRKSSPQPVAGIARHKPRGPVTVVEVRLVAPSFKKNGEIDWSGSSTKVGSAAPATSERLAGPSKSMVDRCRQPFPGSWQTSLASIPMHSNSH